MTLEFKPTTPNINEVRMHHFGEPSAGLMPEAKWCVVAEIAGLTPRELQVAKLLFRGLTRQQIANELSVKIRTVRHHLESLHEKLHVSNRVGVVLRIIQIRFLELQEDVAAST